MRSYRIVAYFMAGVALALAAFAYMNYIYMLGFPDGFITELGYAQRRLAWVFIVMSVVLGVSFVYLGIVGLRKRVARAFTIATILFLITLADCIIVNYFFHFILDAGQGG